jgi:hypothetical protein
MIRRSHAEKNEMASISRFCRILALIPRKISRSWESAYESSGGFLTATLIAWAVELAYGLTSQQEFLGGIRVFCLLWFASGAAFFVGTIAGFLFGVPRARTEPASKGRSAAAPRPEGSPVDRTSLYTDNTNLEEVSDWLTKIIIGIGLAEFADIKKLLGQVAEQVGLAIDPNHQYGGSVIALGSMVIGFATGFLYYYVWARVILRKSLIRAMELPLPPPPTDRPLEDPK